MIDAPQITRTTQQLAAVIHLRIPRDEIQKEMGPAINELIAAITAQGIGPVGPLFTHHLRMDPATFDFDVGFPVSAVASPSGRVKPGMLPAARVAQTVYHGPYEGLHEAWSEFNRVLDTQGHTRATNLWERYVTGPESSADPMNWRTELNRPLQD